MEYRDPAPLPGQLADELYERFNEMLGSSDSIIMIPDTSTEVGKKYAHLYNMSRLPVTEISSATHTNDSVGEYTVYTVSDSIPSYVTESGGINHAQDYSYRLTDEYRFVGYTAERRNRFNDVWNVMSPQEIQIQLDRFAPREAEEEAKLSFVERAKQVARKAIFWSQRDN